jgi:hypothetical protein
MIDVPTLSKINTSRFIFDPKKNGFELEMVDRSYVFDLESERKQWLTYITVVYDLNSEIRRNTREYNQRKIEGAQIAGFNMVDGEFQKGVEDVLLGKNEDFNRAVVQYVYYNYNNDYKLLYVLEESYNRAIFDQGSKLKVVSEKDRKNLTETKLQIEELEERLFGGHETLDMRKALYEGTENIRTRMLRKEGEMEEYEINGLDGFSPYGKYRPEKLTFVGDRIPNI